MAPAEWAAEAPPWVSGELPDPSGVSARILYTRFVRRRNFTGFPFWVSCPPETCSQLAAQARDFAAGAGFSNTVVLSDCGPESIGLFRERRWLPERPVTFPGKRDFKLLFRGSDPKEHALLGEIEHWTQIRVRPGLPDAVEPSPGLDTAGLFSHSPGYGFLASNPAFAGSGLQLECAVHLPALVARHRVQTAQQALNALGMELQPLSLRTPGTAEAGFFRILSRGGMKFSEEQGYARFAGRVKYLLDTEMEALEKWQEKEKNRIEDQVHRSLRVLQEARTLDYGELLGLVSFSRLGAYLGRFQAPLLSKLEDLRVRTQPFHLRFRKPSGAEESDWARAELVRAALEKGGFEAG
jgi:hypothetical protein